MIEKTIIVDGKKVNVFVFICQESERKLLERIAKLNK